MRQTPVAMLGKNLSSTIHYLMLQIHETIGMLLGNSLGQLHCVWLTSGGVKSAALFSLGGSYPVYPGCSSPSWHSRLALSCDLYE